MQLWITSVGALILSWGTGILQLACLSSVSFLRVSLGLFALWSHVSILSFHLWELGGTVPRLWHFPLAFQNSTFLLFTLRPCLSLIIDSLWKGSRLLAKVVCEQTSQKREDYFFWVHLFSIIYCLPVLKQWSLTWVILLFVAALMYGAAMWVISPYCVLLPRLGAWAYIYDHSVLVNIWAITAHQVLNF